MGTATEKYIYPYLLDEGPAVPSLALLFEGLPGAGTGFLGIVKRLPCRTRDNAVGEAEYEHPFKGGVSCLLTCEAGRRPG